MASDKLFFYLFQSNPDLILRWLEDLPADAGGYCFMAPVLKEREYRLDGLFAPPLEWPDLPAVVLEAQMAADQGFCCGCMRKPVAFCNSMPGAVIGVWW